MRRTRASAALERSPELVGVASQQVAREANGFGWRKVVRHDHAPRLRAMVRERDARFTPTLTQRDLEFCDSAMPRNLAVAPARSRPCNAQRNRATLPYNSNDC
jgi:hypothetical protein